MSEAAFFPEYRTALRQELVALLDQPQPIYAMLRYHLGWSDEPGRPSAAEGKMVRGILCLMAAKAAGGDYRPVLPAAAAVEIVHNFSLVHDDIEDVSPLRRHRPTVWKIWGQPQAINAGDALLVLAHLALLRLRERGVPAQRVLQAAGILDAACLELCLGQQKDLSFESRLDVSIDDYLAMISQKTGALFEASLLLGATLSTGEERLVRGLGSFGRKLGLAFQLQDDEMGIWGEAEATGKPTAADIYERKKSLPVIYALEKSVGEEHRELVRIYRQESLGSQDVARVLDILDKMAARNHVRCLAEKCYREALGELEAVGLTDEATRELKEISSFMRLRQS